MSCWVQGSDKYVARSAQTLNLAVKDKETATLVTSTKNASCLSIGFAIEDDYKAKQVYKKEDAYIEHFI